VTVKLTQGWKRMELLVWQTSGSAELVVTYRPAGGGPRQPIPANLLRARSLTTASGEDGQFTILAPAWMEMEAVAEPEAAGVRLMSNAGKQ
jgi:hypothetical protein